MSILLCEPKDESLKISVSVQRDRYLATVMKSMHSVSSLLLEDASGIDSCRAEVCDDDSNLLKPLLRVLQTQDLIKCHM